jgi:hypothetical protein
VPSNAQGHLQVGPDEPTGPFDLFMCQTVRHGGPTVKRVRGTRRFNGFPSACHVGGPVYPPGGVAQVV